MKFIQTLDDKIYSELKERADKLGCTIQALIRVEIIPEWVLVQRKRGKNRESS